MSLPIALSPGWKNPSNAAYAFGVTTTISLLNPMLGALFLFLLLAGSTHLQQQHQQAARGAEPVPPEAAPVSEDTKKRVTAALKAVGP